MRVTLQNWLANLRAPFDLPGIEPPIQQISSQLIPTWDIGSVTREYQGGVLFQAGAAAVLEWRTSLVEPGFVEVYTGISVQSAGGAAPISLRLFLSMHGVATVATQNMILARMDITAGQTINFLGANGDTSPEGKAAFPIEVPAGCHLLVDTTAAAAAGTDLTMKFLRYRKPGAPGERFIEDVSDQITT